MDQESLDEIRRVVRDELNDIFDFTRTCLLSGNMEGVVPRRETPYSGESEFEGTIAEVKSHRAHRVAVPYLRNVKLETLYESKHPSISQKGLLSDENDKILFTFFVNNNLPELEVGKVYNISNLLTNLYQDSFQVNSVTETTIEESPDNLIWKHDGKRTLGELDLI